MASHEGASVLIVQERLPDYRVPLFEGLRARLIEDGVTLRVTYSEPSHHVTSRRDSGRLPWGTTVAAHRAPPPLRAVYQPVVREGFRHDLVIVEQANRLVAGHLLLAMQRFGGPPLAYWGHGANLQASGRISSVSETAKRRLARLPHWWFAYTDGSAARVRASGFPSERITSLNNTVAMDWMTATPPPPTGNNCLYLGALDEHKEIPFLLEAAQRLAEGMPDFTLCIAGDGPLRPLVEQAARRHTWLSYLGRVEGDTKLEAMRRAALLVVPGMVGLIAVDALAAGRPIVTRRAALHSPEFEYLTRDNSEIVDDLSVDAYIQHIAALLRDQRRLAQLHEQCLSDAAGLTIGNMTDRFAAGIRAALRAERRRQVFRHAAPAPPAGHN